MTVAPKRIAFFTYSTKPRGSVVHTIELAAALTRLGHHVCIYALDRAASDSHQSGFDRPISCDYHPVPAAPAPEDCSGDLTDALIRQRIQEFVTHLGSGHFLDHPYDYYHAQDCLSANALGTLRDQQQIPHYVRTIHHIEAFQSPYLQACQEKSIRDPDLCFCVSQYWQEILDRDYQIHAFRTINGVDLNRFSASTNGLEADLKQQLKLTGSPVYLTVGGIEPRKNSIILLQAFAKVLERYPQSQLIIAGGATLFDYQDYRIQFLDCAKALGIEINRSLILPGMIAHDQLPVLYRLADAFLFPSITEGWGLVAIEAIASGLPVVISNQPPFTEFLTSEQVILINPQSVDDIAQAAIKAVQPEFSRSLVQKSQKVLLDYTWEASARLHLQYYENLHYEKRPNSS